MKTSVFGRIIITLAALLQDSVDKRPEVVSDLLPVFKSVFKAAASDGQNNETLFQECFKSMINTVTGNKMSILDQKTSASECSGGTKLPVKQFHGVLHNK